MTLGNTWKKTGIVSIAIAALLTAPSGARAYRSLANGLPGTDAWHNSQESKEQEKEQERRDRDQEKRDREQEARDRAQEKAERLQELYDDGREALDEDRYDQAVSKFKELASMNGPQTDAALYWKAYAENRLGRKAAALATIVELKTKYAQSRWKKDAEALEIEVKQSSGQPVKPADQSDEELKMLAIQGLMNNDSERAIPLLEKVLNGSAAPKAKSKALFVLAQSGSPQALEILAKIARGQSDPDLQRKAVEYLGLSGGAQAKQTLADVYTSSSDPAVKRAVLRSYMISGDHERLFAAAKAEKNDDLKREAIRQLGLVGGNGAAKALQAIYTKETDRELKEEVLNALFIQGNAGALVSIARNEKDMGLKKKAVEKLSLMGSKEANDYLMELLQK